MKWPRSLRSGVLAAWGVVAPLALSSNAYALEVGLDVHNCANVPEMRVRELAALELSTPVVRPHLGERMAVSVSVSCAKTDVSIQVADATTGKTVSRTFALLVHEPDVRARAVALAAAELVLSSWMELAIAPPGDPAKPKGAAATEDLRAATAIVRSRTARAAHVDALLAFSTFGGTFHAKPQ